MRVLRETAMGLGQSSPKKPYLDCFGRYEPAALKFPQPLSSFHSGNSAPTLPAMFDTIVAEMTTAAGKLAHLRRFL